MARGDAAFMTAVAQAIKLADDFSRSLGKRIRDLVAAFSPLSAATRSRLMQQIDAILNAAFGLTQRAALLSDLYLTILTATDAAASRPFTALFTRIETAVNLLGPGLWNAVRSGMLGSPASDALARAYTATTSFGASRTAYLRTAKLDPNRRWVKGDGTS
ncbi:MAG TPA: hypothetical protein VFQ54_12465, partial [Thermomicrobiales bacterium]|nr:hypothetical protein [Thermomicrobiales bacterium]